MKTKKDKVKKERKFPPHPLYKKELNKQKECPALLITRTRERKLIMQNPIIHPNLEEIQEYIPQERLIDENEWMPLATAKIDFRDLLAHQRKRYVKLQWGLTPLRRVVSWQVATNAYHRFLYQLMVLFGVEIEGFGDDLSTP